MRPAPWAARHWLPCRHVPFLSRQSACDIPSSALAYSLNFTAVPQAGLGYLSAWPTGQPWPGVSTLNAPPGDPVVANAAIVPAGPGGEINVLGSNNTDVVIDINGYFAPPGSAPGGLALYPVTPCRVLDTRSSSGLFDGMLAVDIAGSCGTPTAQAFVLNATVVPSGGLGYLTLWPENEAQPLVSTLNADDGVIAFNMAIVPTTNGQSMRLRPPTQLILDINGYFGTYAYTLTVTNSGWGVGTITSSDGEINCGTTCSATYPAGSYVVLTAVLPSEVVWGAGPAPHAFSRAAARRNAE